MGARGKESAYTVEYGQEICNRLASESLAAVCESEDMPSRATVFRWIEQYPEMRDGYARAVKERALYRAERIERLSQELIDGKHDANRARVALDALKWVAAKLDPVRYSDRVVTAHTGADGGPIQIIDAGADAETAARLYQDQIER